MIEQPRLLALVGGNIGRKPPYSQWKQCFALISSFPYTKDHQTIEGYVVDTFWEIEKTTYHPNRRSKEKQNGFTRWVKTSLWMCVYPHNSTMFNIVQPCSTILPQFCVWNPVGAPGSSLSHPFSLFDAQNIPFLVSYKYTPPGSTGRFINVRPIIGPIGPAVKGATTGGWIRLGEPLEVRTPPENQKSSAAVIILQDLRFSFAP